MLNRFYYLQTDHGGETAGRRKALDANIPIAHLVGGNPGMYRTLLAHQYSDQGNYPFCLALHCLAVNNLDGPLDQTLRELLLFFFHPYYQWGDGGKPLFVFLPPEKEPGKEPGKKAAGNVPAGNVPAGKLPAGKVLAFRRQTQEFFAAQGLQIELLFINPGSAGGPIRVLENKDNDPAGEYYRYCINHWSPDDIFLLPETSPGTVIDDLQAVTDDLRLEHPAFSKLVSENVRFRQQLALLDRDNVRLKEENTILNELTELGSRHNEVDYILRFYKNEYEILPLWYKRFGHIIKVIQGRRSFRSLYDKKVKKYKD